jgi:hypothetical protein
MPRLDSERGIVAKTGLGHHHYISVKNTILILNFEKEFKLSSHLMKK